MLSLVTKQCKTYQDETYPPPPLPPEEDSKKMALQSMQNDWNGKKFWVIFVIALQSMQNDWNGTKFWVKFVIALQSMQNDWHGKEWWVILVIATVCYFLPCNLQLGILSSCNICHMFTIQTWTQPYGLLIFCRNACVRWCLYEMFCLTCQVTDN